jgi:hypothetical protein
LTELRSYCNVKKENWVKDNKWQCKYESNDTG